MSISFKLKENLVCVFQIWHLRNKYKSTQNVSEHNITLQYCYDKTKSLGSERKGVNRSDNFFFYLI